MWGYATLALVGLALCTVFGYSYGRWQANQRAIRLDVITEKLPNNDWQTVVNVANRGRVPKEQVIVRIQASAPSETWREAHIARLHTKQQLKMHAAERSEDDGYTCQSTFVYMFDGMQPRDSVDILVTYSAEPIEVTVAASASVESGSYIYPKPEFDGLVGAGLF